MAAVCGLSEDNFNALLSQVDKFQDQEKAKEMYDALVKYKDTKAVEILWRFAWAATELGRVNKSKSKIYEASGVIERALALEGTNPEVRKVYANILRYTGEYEGPKAQVQNSYIIKAHLELARQLKPNDPAIYYSLGCWSFAFADIGRVARKLAGTTGVKPPKSTYEEAMEYFVKAEEISPGFSAMNLYMLGKTFNALGKKESAIPYLIRARDFAPCVKHDDREAHKKAVKLLGKLNVKK